MSVIFSSFVDEVRKYIDPCQRKDLKASLTYMQEFASVTVQVCRAFRIYVKESTVTGRPSRPHSLALRVWPLQCHAHWMQTCIC